LVHLAPADLLRINEVTLDARVLAYAVLVTLGSSLLFGLVPALNASRLEIIDVLKSRGAASPRQRTLLRTIVMAEVAFSMVLVIAAALFLRTFMKIESVDPGFVADHLVAVRISLPQPAYSSPARFVAFTKLWRRG
jgi:hypothetical protein